MITLKKNADRRIRRGHLWVFSNEVGHPPVSELEAGSIHELRDAGGEFLGMVYANPASLICARILSRRRVEIDALFFRTKIESALELRKRIFPSRDSYRVVFGEGDLLPGLIVDRYARYLAVQSLTAGIDGLMNEVLEALIEVLSPEGIYLRNDAPVRALEGLPLEKKLAHGSVPDMVTIASNGLKFLVDIPNGQKTGFYLDQESNRSLVRQYVFPGAHVLDLFCYTAAWGINAAASGADKVVALDSSRGALSLAVSNAALNGLDQNFYAIRESALEFLKKSRDTWDVIVLDPPAFIKSRSGFKEGQKGYIDINRRAMGKLNPGGVIITCSCSHHLTSQDFEELLLSASRQSGRDLRILEVRGQGPDHPILLSMPETRYLKVIAAQAL
ncbi:MAG: class I SAM-dependent rRNA methyltransferase [Desulfomonile tiedjei]|nr:class I SAM-dependent rRNA methyltransferase [Desulfomonile tiedjei]